MNMRLMIIGAMEGDLTTATKIALERGAHLIHCQTLEEALTCLRQGQGADLLFVDVQHDIQTLVQNLSRERICIPVVACGSATEEERAVEAIRAGAQEYLPLPPDPDLIASLLEAVSTPDDPILIFKDPAMARVVELAQRIASSEASVLLTGESGTGKERMARLIHRHSKRASKPFIAVNSAAIPEHLLESELFGHEKGAFTGAVARRVGKFEEAQGGTLLLDEISEMHPRLQAKLLRALQEKEIDRLGGKTPVKVNIRVIATSNRDLKEAVRQGDFREDLYFRLNVMSLHIPPLRERPLDIMVLAQHFIQKYARLNHIPFKPLSASAQEHLKAYPWDGNVRELENMMHRAVVLNHSEEIYVDHILQEALQNRSLAEEDPSGTLVGRTVADVERELILNTLHHCLGNRTQAAQILGISIRTLRNKLHLYTQNGSTEAVEKGQPPLRSNYG